jgi:hypothetical protein
MNIKASAKYMVVGGKFWKLNLVQSLFGLVYVSSPARVDFVSFLRLSDNPDQMV